MKDILQESAKTIRKQRFKQPFRGPNLMLTGWLQNMNVQIELDQAGRSRLLSILGNRSLSGFERDPALKVLLERMKKSASAC